MPATHEPFSSCNGIGHVCKDADPTEHIHEHDPAAPVCKKCGGRGLVPIPARAAGGPVEGGALVTVGDRGPELVAPAKPRRRSRRASPKEE